MSTMADGNGRERHASAMTGPARTLYVTAVDSTAARRSTAIHERSIDMTVTTEQHTDGTATDDQMVEDLRAALRGEVITRSAPEFDAARRVWNGLIDHHPAVIARCTGTADVIEAVRVARRHQPIVSIRGGGHQVAGSAVLDDALVIDLSQMTGVHVDPQARTARVQPGATWGDVDRECQIFGLATPGGEVSITGVAGLTLGGGMGHLQRRHGLSCDNLRSIELVTADGMVRRASRHEHQDLFWAARGGGRGLGVVTSFEFDLHPIGPDVAVGQFIFPYEEAESVMRGFRDVAPTMPDTVSPELVIWSIPPDPEIPEEMHWSKAVFVLAVYAGSPTEAGDVFEPLEKLGTPIADLSGTYPYVAVQSDVDAMIPDGIRAYMKSHFADELSDDAITTLLEHDASRPSPLTLIAIRTLGGAVARFDRDDSAYAHRDATFNVSIDAFWDDAGLDETAVGWARSAWDAFAPFSTGGVYVNFSGLHDEADAVRPLVQGASAERLERIRAEYDPDGIFEAAAKAP
jgi:FAD/FMN-containing dehydrogenase